VIPLIAFLIGYALIEKQNRMQVLTPRPPPHRHALIEKQNRITHNDRHPLMTGWTFCDFLKRYNRPEHENMLYTVTPLSEAGSTLRRFLWLPEPLRCSHY
jgi:hypothetical protein